jgi:AraC-like DNA-binding protein
MLTFDQPVITSYFILPHPLLQPFVDNYFLCTSQGEKIFLNSPWPASNETSLIFYLADQPVHYPNMNKPSPPRHEGGCIVGLQSGCNGVVQFKGVFQTFIIQFKANGFNKLFALSARNFVNKVYYMDEVFGSVANALNEKLQNAGGILPMAEFADQFLLHFLTRQKKTILLHDGISFVANELFSGSALQSVDSYALKANMSVRNFGRRFTEQVGVSPKFYCRLLRFSNAVNTKIKKAGSSWTSIAYECGYYDQMHMIRDFKEFANVSPRDLFSTSGEFTRPRIDVNESSSEGFNDLNSQLGNEKFIRIGRTAF